MNPSPPYLLLPLIGGYLFLESCNYTRFYFRKHEGYRLLFASAAVGAALLFLARIVLLVSAWVVPWWSTWQHGFKVFAPFAYSGTMTVALILGFLLGLGSSFRRESPSSRVPRTRFTSKFHRWRYHHWPFRLNKFEALRAVAERTDELLLLLLDAPAMERPILLTLKNGKVYAGFVLEIAHLGPEVPYVKLLPTVSGYRTEGDLFLELRTVYDDSINLIAKVRARQATATDEDAIRSLQIVVRRDEILTASFFNNALYERHKKERPPRDGGNAGETMAAVLILGRWVRRLMRRGKETSPPEGG